MQNYQGGYQLRTNIKLYELMILICIDFDLWISDITFGMVLLMDGYSFLLQNHNLTILNSCFALNAIVVFSPIGGR